MTDRTWLLHQLAHWETQEDLGMIPMIPPVDEFFS